MWSRLTLMFTLKDNNIVMIIASCDLKSTFLIFLRFSFFEIEMNPYIGWNIKLFNCSIPTWKTQEAYSGYSAESLLNVEEIYLHFICAGLQKSLRSDFDMAYERGRISVSAEDGNTPPNFPRVSTLRTVETDDTNWVITISVTVEVFSLRITINCH